MLHLNPEQEKDKTYSVDSEVKSMKLGLLAYFWLTFWFSGFNSLPCFCRLEWNWNYWRSNPSSSGLQTIIKDSVSSFC